MSMVKSGLILFCLSSTWVIANDLVPHLGQEAVNESESPQFNLSIFPDGQGLPEGQGDAKAGEIIFAAQCAQCHGPAGRGGTAEALTDDVGSLKSEYPEKTVNSYWPYATTLFDYIRRSMPPEAPYSLTNNEIYALCAYLLSQDDIIDADLVLNKHNLPQVKMPNRDGFVSVYEK